jgi:hypothetical protein
LYLAAWEHFSSMSSKEWSRCTLSKHELMAG